MSKLEQLITELCPNGVEFIKFGNIATILRGGSPRPIMDFLTAELDGINWIKIGDVNKGGKYISSTKEKIKKEGVSKSRYVKAGDFVLSNSMSFGRPYILKIDGCIHDGWLAISDFSASFIPDFLYHLLGSDLIQKIMSQKASNGTVQNLNADIVKSIKLPVPPLPIQREIVRILDKFKALEAELEAELEARRKQYGYYRNHLLNFGDDIPMSKLGKVATNLDSKRKPVTKGIREMGEFPYYGASGIVDYVSDYIFDGDYLLVSEDGANLVARATPIAFSATGKIWVNNHAHVLKFETYFERKYIEYYLNMIDLSHFISTAAQPKLTQDNLNRIPVPVPPLGEQERIVAILDRFDALVNDITQGLTAEIAARRKQYEYYRDKLLTFKEAVS